MILQKNNDMIKTTDYQKRCNHYRKDYLFGEVNLKNNKYEITFSIKGVPLNLLVSKISKKEILKHKNYLSLYVKNNYLTEVLKSQIKSNKMTANTFHYYKGIDCSETAFEKKAKNKELDKILNFLLVELVRDAKSCATKRKKFWLTSLSLQKGEEVTKIVEVKETPIDFDNLTKFSVHEKNAWKHRGGG